jgi:hypothetical protein
MKGGPWNEGALQMKAAGLKFVYDLEGGLFRLNLDPGKAGAGGGEQSPGVIVSANYHVDVRPGSAVADVEEVIRAFPRRCSHLAEAVRTVLGLKE